MRKSISKKVSVSTYVPRRQYTNSTDLDEVDFKARRVMPIDNDTKLGTIELFDQYLLDYGDTLLNNFESKLRAKYEEGELGDKDFIETLTNECHFITYSKNCMARGLKF